MKKNKDDIQHLFRMPLQLNTNKCNYALKLTQMSQNYILLHCTIEITQEDIRL